MPLFFLPVDKSYIFFVLSEEISIWKGFSAFCDSAEPSKRHLLLGQVDFSTPAVQGLEHIVAMPCFCLPF